MKGLFFILFSTFLVGMASGVFVYFMSNLDEPIIELPEGTQSEDFSITADAYGGCQRAGECASYRINADGSYIYIVLRREGTNERIEGKLSAGERKELKSLIARTPLADVHTSTFSGTCPAAVDGNAYVYEIRVEDASYRIDTCAHNTNDQALFVQLETYFSTLR